MAPGRKESQGGVSSIQQGGGDCRFDRFSVDER